MQYKVDTEAIESIVARIRMSHNNILGILSDLHAINSELDASWDGESQMEFESRFGNWLVHLEKSGDTFESVLLFLSDIIRVRRYLDEQASNAAAGFDNSPASNSNQ
jgi:WXG100 family type VII secretion target